MQNVSNDVTIISGDNEEIQSNKYILSLFCPTIRHLLSASSILLLPECSIFSIKYLLNVINNGFAVAEKLSNEDINEIIETAKVLTIQMNDLYHDETVPNIPESNKVATCPSNVYCHGLSHTTVPCYRNVLRSMYMPMIY